MDVRQRASADERECMTKSYDILKKLVWEAFQRVKANRGGVKQAKAWEREAQESIVAFEKNLSANLYKVWNRMSAGSYFPPPVKSVPIPKKSGGVRVLGVPTVADRVAQTVVKLVMEPVLPARVRRGLIRISATAICAGCCRCGSRKVLAISRGLPDPR
jgi:retron-type reverse transcriptase